MAQDSFEMNPTQLTALENASMPQNSDAEFSILSAMILSEEIRGECLIRLSSEDFYIPSNQIIFEAIKSLFDNNKPVDVISLADHLKSNGKFERAGGAVRLAELGNNPLAMVGWENHANMLHRDTTLRKMISASAKISALAYNAPEDTKQVVDQAEKLIFDVTNRDVQQSEQGIEEIMTDLFEELQQNAEKDASELGVQTGFATLDNLFQGLRPGQMVVIGARPGVGKTSFALSMAYNAAVSGATVALFSLEMSKIEIAQRLLASESKVDLQTIRSSKIRNEQWPTLLEAAERISRLKIIVDDTPGTTVTEIRAKARRMLNKAEKGVIIIDYLQLLSPPAEKGRADSRATEVSEMSRGIKIMAKDLKAPVIALSQLNRTLENRNGKRPQLSDLRESGSIEQDADIVLLLDRSLSDEEAARDDRPDKDVTNIIVAKNRAGALKDVPVMFIPTSTKFVELYQGNNYSESEAAQYAAMANPAH